MSLLSSEIKPPLPLTPSQVFLVKFFITCKSGRRPFSKRRSIRLRFILARSQRELPAPPGLNRQRINVNYSFMIIIIRVFQSIIFRYCEVNITKPYIQARRQKISFRVAKNLGHISPNRKYRQKNVDDLYFLF